MVSASIQRRIDRWFPGAVAAHDVYLRMVAERAAPAERVLHLGAGRDILNVRSALAGKIAVALDLGREGLLQNPNHRRVVADAGCLPVQNETFDLIVCEHVFEHLERPGLVLAECARALRQGGSLVFLTPNRLSYIAVVSALTPHRFHVAYRSRLAAITEADTFPTFYRLNTRRRIRDLGERAGLRLDRYATITGCPTYLELNDFVHRIGVLGHWLIERGPSTFHISLVGALSKPAD